MNGGVFTHNNTTAPAGDRVIPLFSLKGRTAIVSGAGAGIGKALSSLAVVVHVLINWVECQRPCGRPGIGGSWRERCNLVQQQQEGSRTC